MTTIETAKSVFADCLTPADFARIEAQLSEPGYAEKLGERVLFAQKRPQSASSIASLILGELPASKPAAAPALPSEAKAPPALPAEQPAALYSVAVGSDILPGQYTLAKARELGASLIWRDGMDSWQPLDSVKPAKPAAPKAPKVDGFSIPWPASVQLAKNGKHYANLRGIKPLAKGLVGIELGMLRAILTDPKLSGAILAECERLQA